jgi:hypothetical protein
MKDTCPTCGGRDVEPMPEGADVLQRPEAWCGEYWIRESEYDALVAERQRLKEELKVTDHLLDERELVLRAIPECPAHGACVPHALEWIEKTKGAEAALAQLQQEYRDWLTNMIAVASTEEPATDFSKWITRRLEEKLRALVVPKE